MYDYDPNTRATILADSARLRDASAQLQRHAARAQVATRRARVQIAEGRAARGPRRDARPPGACSPAAAAAVLHAIAELEAALAPLVEAGAGASAVDRALAAAVARVAAELPDDEFGAFGRALAALGHALGVAAVPPAAPRPPRFRPSLRRPA